MMISTMVMMIMMMTINILIALYLFKPRSKAPTKEISATWNPKAGITMEYRKETAGQVAVEQMSMVTMHCTSRGGKEKQRNNEGTKTKIGEE